MAHRGEDPSQWLTATEAAALLGVSRFTFTKIGESGRIGRKTLPGCRTRFNRADLERLARESIEQPDRRPRGERAEAVAS